MPSATRNGGRRGSGATGRGGNASAARSGPPPPAPTARVSLASLAELIRQIQTDRDSDGLAAAVGELREELRALHEQLSATQEEVAAMADDREAAIDMCEQMQLSIAGYQQPGAQADELPPTGRRADEKEFFAAWRILGVRKVWITIGEKPAVYNLKRAEMQALLGDVALASDETTNQLNTFTGFRVGAYMAEGDTPRLAANMFLPEQLEIMVDAILAVVGNGVCSEDGADRLSMLGDGLREGLSLLRIHCRKHRLKAVLPENKALMATLVDADMKEYCQRLFTAAVAVAKAAPPAIENMPGVVVPTWPALTNYIRGGGLLGAAASPTAGAGRTEKRDRQTSGRGNGFGDCYAWTEARGCRFGEKCVYAHPANKKYRPSNGRGGTSGRASNDNGRTGGGGGPSPAGRGRDGRPKPGGGSSASGSSGGGSAAARGVVALAATPSGRG